MVVRLHFMPAATIMVRLNFLKLKLVLLFRTLIVLCVFLKYIFVNSSVLKIILLRLSLSKKLCLIYVLTVIAFTLSVYSSILTSLSKFIDIMTPLFYLNLNIFLQIYWHYDFCFQYLPILSLFYFLYQALTIEEDISFKNKNNIEKTKLSYWI